MKYYVSKPLCIVFYIAAFFMVAFFCANCTDQTNNTQTATAMDTAVKGKPPVDVSLPGGFSTQTIIRFDSAAILVFIKQYPSFKVFETQIQQFYTVRNYTYAWFDNDGVIEQAGNLYNKISNIAEEGIPEKILYKDAFALLMEGDSSGVSMQKANTAAELMLTAQYFFYAKNVWNGLGAIGMQALDWDLPQKKLSHKAILDSLLEVPSSMFMATEPVYHQYALLKEYLKKYRVIETAGGWAQIKTDRKTYHKGDSSAEIAAIRHRLFLLEDISADNKSEMFDATLEEGVKNFQQRYGFKDDGIIHSLLITEMNYSVEKRIEQIIVNMERCRWVPVALKKDYIVVNIPEYRFHAYENDSLTWSMNVVVGTSMNKTAIFNGMMNSVVFSPYWNVPPGIMKNETLPAMRRDKNYLARNHMEWNGNAVRQIPGPWNALGKVKFLFPNSHNIYLHDTPSKNAFGNDRRAFSHGCIRVSDPRRLAIYILRNQPDWTESKIDAAMNASKEQYVKINNPVPVFIAYFTSWVDKKGRLNFRDDVYKRDSRLAKMIIENTGL